MKCKVPGWFSDIGLFLIRAMLAAVFVFHGGQKLFGWFHGPGLQGAAHMFAQLGIAYPSYSAVLASSVEFFGACCLLLGLCTRLVAIPMAFDMAVAIFVVHLRHGFALSNNGMEYPLTLGVVLLALVFTGGGRIALWPCGDRR